MVQLYVKRNFFAFNFLFCYNEFVLVSLFFSNLSILEVLLQLLILIITFVFSLSLRCWAQAFSAYKMGDATAKLSGRLTLNPFKHFDLIGFLFFIIVGVGWSKNVPINPTNFKDYRKGIRWVALSGILANFILGLVAMFVYLILFKTVGCTNEYMNYVYICLSTIMQLNGCLVMFNLLPIYPLDGFNFVSTYLTGQNRYVQFNIKYGIKILYFILIFSLCCNFLFGVDLFAIYIDLLYNYIYLPIALL